MPDEEKPREMITLAERMRRAGECPRMMRTWPDMYETVNVDELLRRLEAERRSSISSSGIGPLNRLRTNRLWRLSGRGISEPNEP